MVRASPGSKRGRHIHELIVAGRPIVRGGRVLSIDYPALREDMLTRLRSAMAQNGIRRRYRGARPRRQASFRSPAAVLLRASACHQTKGANDWFARLRWTQHSWLIGRYVMSTDGHREPCDWRGSCTAVDERKRGRDPGQHVPSGAMADVADRCDGRLWGSRDDR
jgi:hypothetical protein